MAETESPEEARAEAPSADVLADAVATLTLAGTSPPPPETFIGVHDALPAFNTIKDLGTFVWQPRNPSHEEFKSHADATAEDIHSRLDVVDGLKGIPVLNITDLSLPTTFPRLKPQRMTNRFPNDPGVAAALAAAAARGVVVQEMDFVFGGSTLHVLASRSTGGNVYLVQRVGNAIVIGKHSEYVGDMSAKGFQFERFVTGESMAARATEDSVVGMQLASVGPFRVFFHAELDAVDADGTRVEIKSGNPCRFGEKEMYQMVSSRSSSLVYAECRGDKLCAIEKCGLDKVAGWVPPERRNAMQDAILSTMRELKEKVAELREDEPSQLAFTINKCVELRAHLARLLPSVSVIAALTEPASEYQVSRVAGVRSTWS